MPNYVPEDDLPVAQDAVSPTTRAIRLEAKTPAEIDFLKRIFKQESNNGANTTTSNAGAVGPGQIVPNTFKSVADKDWDISNAHDSAQAAARYALQLFKQAGGDIERAAAAYYGGPDEIKKSAQGIAAYDKRNPNAPNTLQYGKQVSSHDTTNVVPEDDLPDADVQKMAANPDVMYEELLTSVRQGNSEKSQQLFEDYVRSTFVPGNDPAKLYEATKLRLEKDLAQFKTPSLGNAMTAESKVFHPAVTDAAKINARRAMGQMAEDDSVWQNAMVTAGYTADQFLKGGRNIVDMAEYLAQPIQAPIDKAIRNWQNKLPFPGADEVLQKYSPAYKTMRNSLIGDRSAQDIFLPTKTRQQISQDYMERQKVNDAETEEFAPYMNHSGVGGFFGPMLPYIASQQLFGPVVKGAISGVSDIVGSTAKTAAIKTGHGIKIGAEAIQKHHVPVLSDIIAKAKSDYGPRVLNEIGHIKNKSQLPLSVLHKGIASNATNNIALSMLESMNRPDEDWKQGLVAGIGGNAISGMARGVLSELPSNLGPREAEVLARMYAKGYVPDAGIKSGNLALQRQIQGIKNSSRWGPLAQPFVDKQNDVKANIVYDAMGIKRKKGSTGISTQDWENFWGKNGLGGEMDFRDANTGASYGPQYRDSIQSLLDSIKDNDLPGTKLAYKRGLELQKILENRSPTVSSIGPVMPRAINTGDMKQIMEGFNQTIAAYSRSDNSAKVNAVPYLKGIGTILDDMINDVQVPKGLKAPNGAPYNADYIRDLNRRYAVASTVNNEALDLTGEVNPSKLMASIANDPKLLKRTLRGNNDPNMQNISDLATLIEMEKKSYHSPLEGSPISDTTGGKKSAKAVFSELPKDMVPSILDVYRVDRNLRGIPSMTGLPGYIGLPGMRNDRSLYTPYTLGRIDMAGAHINKDVVDWLEEEYNAWHTLTGGDRREYTEYLKGKLQENNAAVLSAEPLRQKLGTLAKRVPYTAAYGISALVDLLSKQSENKE